MDTIPSFFQTPEQAPQVLAITSEAQLLRHLERRREASNYLVLGEGSNILFTKNFDGVVLKNQIIGKPIIEKTSSTHVRIRFPSGTVWHQCVLYAAKNHLWGIENLALIPGLLGAAPVQNIGAYGREFVDCKPIITAINLNSLETISLDCLECDYGYRDSLFKHSLRDQYFITSVSLEFCFERTYQAAHNDMTRLKGLNKLSNAGVVEAICELRRKKLPSPVITPNAGSFFKNPLLDMLRFEQLQTIDKQISHHKISDKVKISAAYLIEKGGLKGYVHHDGAEVSSQHALVLINPKKLSGECVLKLAEHVIHTVYQLYGITLEPEVRIL